MKKLLIILLFITSFTAYSQIDTTQYVTDSNVEKLVDKYSAKIEASIISLAETLKQPAEFVYQTLVRQQYVKVITGLFIIITTILFAFISLKYASNIKDWSDLKVKENKPTYSFVCALIFGVLAFILLISIFLGSYPQDIIQGLVNPHYGAIKDISELIK